MSEMFWRLSCALLLSRDRLRTFIAGAGSARNVSAMGPPGARDARVSPNFMDGFSDNLSPGRASARLCYRIVERRIIN